MSAVHRWAWLTQTEVSEAIATPTMAQSPPLVGKVRRATQNRPCWNGHDDSFVVLAQSVLLDICEIGPWEKWTRYRVLPVKFLLHALLVFFTTWSVIEDSVRSVI